MCLRTGSAGQMSFRVRNTEGRYRWFLSRAEPVRASDGTLLYWIGVNLDIEDRKRAEFHLAEGQRLAHMGRCTFNADGMPVREKGVVTRFVGTLMDITGRFNSVV